MIFVPIYCAYRIRKNQYTLLNGSFHVLVLSYLYFTLSSFFLEDFIEFRYSIEPWFSTFSVESIEITSLLCNWFTFVSLFFYMLSKDPKEVRFAFFPQKITYQISLIVTVIIVAIFSLILIIYGPILLADGSRGGGLRIFATEMIGKYKYIHLLNILLASLSIIAWRKRNFRWFVVLIIPIITELLSKGRSLSFFVLVYAYLNYIAVTRKLNLVLFSPLMIGIIATVFFRAGDLERFEGIGAVLLYFFGEVYATRLTTVITYDSFLNDGDLFSYFLSSVLNIFPSSVTYFLVDPVEPYQNIIQNYYKHKLTYSETGLAGNIISETLFYGGIPFAIITPIIIGAIFLFLNKMKIYRTLPGLIGYCFLIARLRNFFRISFYDAFFEIITVMFTFLLWIVILEYSNKRIHPILDKPTLVARPK